MTPTQREVALRLADALCGIGFVANDLNLAADLLRELAAAAEDAGVFLEAASGKWACYITVNGRNVRVGTYNNKARAIAARNAAEVVYWVERKDREMTEGEFTVVPIVEKFGSQNPIGELRILTAALPPTPGFVFTLGFQALEMEARPGHVPTAPYVGAYRLCEVVMQYDESYIAYLRQVGKL